ncbi:MAG TPA: TadE family protein [Archangium sp.]|nr:TadE family protein [Archangium sp.]
MYHLLSTRRRPGRTGRRWRRGSSTVEFAIMAPVLVALVLWSNYFWEVLRVRIKAAEAARFVAFERTVRKDVAQIAVEAQERYKDLDGVKTGGTLGTAFRNKLTLSVSASDVPAPLTGSLSDAGSRGGVSGLIGTALSLVGNSVETIIGKLGFDTSKGAVKTQVQVKLENQIIPERIGQFVTGFSDTKLDLTFTESFFMYHDTWRAWQPGDNPKASQAIVENRVRERVREVAYMGLAEQAGGVLGPIGDFLGVLGLEFPFDTDYVDQAVLIRGVYGNGYYPTPTPAGTRPTRTMPGDILQAAYWTGDNSACFGSCEPKEIKYKRGQANGSGRGDNWPMHAYNCRGPFFQGTVKSDAPESEYAQGTGLAASQSYFNYKDNACGEDPNAEYKP